MAGAPVHAFLDFLNAVLSTIYFPSAWLLSHIVETMDSSERGMNPVAMTIILGKYYGGAGDRTSFQVCNATDRAIGLGFSV